MRRRNVPTPCAAIVALDTAGSRVAEAARATELRARLCHGLHRPELEHLERRGRRGRRGPGGRRAAVRAVSRIATRGRDHQRQRDQEHQAGDEPVDGVLDRKLEALWVHGPGRHQRQAAEVLDGEPVRDGLEEARHERDAEAELLAAPDEPEQTSCGAREKVTITCSTPYWDARGRDPSWLRAREAAASRPPRPSGPCRGSRPA